VVTGAELVTSVVVNTNPGADGLFDSYPINPCEEYTFPRLSQEGVLYQQYCVKSLEFTYVPQSGAEQSGVLAIGFQADPTAAIPQSIEEMNSLFGTQTGNCWQPMKIAVPSNALARTLSKFYNKAAVTPDPAADDRLQTCGRLVFMTQGVDFGTTIGQLRVRYQMEFSDPRPSTQGATTTMRAVWQDGAVDTGQEPSLAAYPFDLAIGQAASRIVGLQSFFPRETAEHAYWMKRTSHSVLLAIAATQAVVGGVDDFIRLIKTDSAGTEVTVTPIVRHNTLLSGRCTALYVLPTGKYRIHLVAQRALNALDIITTSINREVIDSLATF